MTHTLAPVRRIAALSVAICLFAVPLASAQSPEAVSAVASPAKTALLSPAAFARLMQAQRTDVSPAPSLIIPPRVDLVRSAIATPTGERFRLKASATSTNWVKRHKVLAGVLIGVGAFFGAVLICFAACEE